MPIGFSESWGWEPSISHPGSHWETKWKTNRLVFTQDRVQSNVVSWWVEVYLVNKHLLSSYFVLCWPVSEVQAALTFMTLTVPSSFKVGLAPFIIEFVLTVIINDRNSTRDELKMEGRRCISWALWWNRPGDHWNQGMTWQLVCGSVPFRYRHTGIRMGFFYQAGSKT